MPGLDMPKRQSLFPVTYQLVADSGMCASVFFVCVCGRERVKEKRERERVCVFLQQICVSSTVFKKMYKFIKRFSCIKLISVYQIFQFVCILTDPNTPGHVIHV